MSTATLDRAPGRRRRRPGHRVRGVSLRYISADGHATVALRDFSMAVARGEFIAIVGPTGCGKSTTLNMITGLLKPTVGEVRIMGQAVGGIDPRIGFVFQADAVFPWRNVLDNVAAGPLFRGASKDEAYARAQDWIGRVGLGKFGGHYPHQLSGGMRKRVALAQTFVNQPEILLMDEPFSALDMQTRTLMQDELLQLWSASGSSVVFVTHDLERPSPWPTASSCSRPARPRSSASTPSTCRARGSCRRSATTRISSNCPSASGTTCAKRW
jgi:NitT/TauT family transport system ATP-binding protein